MKNKLLNTIVMVCISCFASGLIFFGWYHHYLIFMTPANANDYTLAGQAYEKKLITLWYHKQDIQYHETTELIWPQSTSLRAYTIITRWLALLEEEEVLSKKITIETCITNERITELFISLDRTLFTKHQSAYQKLLLVQDLLQTLQENGIQTGKIHFLIHHKPLEDVHLDFSNPWPIEGFVTKNLSP